MCEIKNNCIYRLFLFFAGFAALVLILYFYFMDDEMKNCCAIKVFIIILFAVVFVLACCLVFFLDCNTECDYNSEKFIRQNKGKIKLVVDKGDNCYTVIYKDEFSDLIQYIPEDSKICIYADKLSLSKDDLIKLSEKIKNQKVIFVRK